MFCTLLCFQLTEMHDFEVSRQFLIMRETRHVSSDHGPAPAKGSAHKARKLRMCWASKVRAAQERVKPGPVSR